MRTCGVAELFKRGAPHRRCAPPPSQVLDKADFIFLAVLPKQVPDVLKALTFTPKHFVVSLVAGVGNGALAELMPTVPTTSIVRAVVSCAAARGGG